MVGVEKLSTFSPTEIIAMMQLQSINAEDDKRDDMYWRHHATANSRPSRKLKVPSLEESTDHIFRQCHEASLVWQAVGHCKGAGGNEDTKCWVYSKISKYRSLNLPEDWATTFSTTCWWLWKWRNAKAFGELGRKYTTSGVNCRIRWQAADADHTKKWDGGFSSKENHQCASVLEAKAIIEGLRWAWGKGVRDVEVQTDAWDVLRWVEGQHMLRGPMQAIIEDIKQWQTRFSRLRLRAIWRE
nr:hypothetical protein DM860_010389 [Ipomoea batatas]